MTFPVETRTAILFMSERTLLSFVIFEGKRFDAEAIAKIFWGGLSQLLVLEGFAASFANDVVDSYPELVLTKTANASRTAQVSSLIRDFKQVVASKGGLKRCDIGIAISELNRRPRKALSWCQRSPNGAT